MENDINKIVKEKIKCCIEFVKKRKKLTIGVVCGVLFLWFLMFGVNDEVKMDPQIRAKIEHYIRVDKNDDRYFECRRIERLCVINKNWGIAQIDSILYNISWLTAGEFYLSKQNKKKLLDLKQQFKADTTSIAISKVIIYFSRWYQAPWYTYDKYNYNDPEICFNYLPTSVVDVIRDGKDCVVKDNYA